MTRAATGWLGGWAALLVAGSLVAAAARRAGPLPGDLAVAQALQAALPLDGGLVSFLIAIGNAVWFLPVLAVAVALLLRQWRASLILLLASIGGAILGEVVLKTLVARPRPSADLVRVYEPSSSYGFPSATSILACVLFGLVSYFVWQAHRAPPSPRRPSGAVARLTVAVSLVLVLATGLSRVLLGAHWPSDVLASWLFGGAWLLSTIIADRWWLVRDRLPGPAAAREAG